jgi:peptidoglycan/xylan/chitin deacetylase (PgdA/CDA1 family)
VIQPYAVSFSTKAARVLAEGAVHTLDHLRLLDLAVRRAPRRYILAYHRVLPADRARDEWCHPAMWISPTTLREHFAFFQRVGTLVSLEQILASEHELERPLFSITFDDAWIDNYEYARASLTEFGIRACFFVPTEAVTTGRLFWTEEVAQHLGNVLAGPTCERFAQHMGWSEINDTTSYTHLLRRLMQLIEALKELPAAERDDRIVELYRRFGVQHAPIHGRVMSWAQIRSLAQEGHDIGSHSKTHLILKNLEQDVIDDELRSSKQEIESRLGLPVRYFCYPNARYDDLSISRVVAAGYSHGFRMHNLPIPSNCAKELVPRFSASEENAYLAKLKARLLRAAGA